MKWKPIEPKQGDFEVDIPNDMIAWAKKNNITVRGDNSLKNTVSENLFFLFQVIVFCGPRLQIIHHGHGPSMEKSLQLLFINILMIPWITSTLLESQTGM